MARMLMISGALIFGVGLLIFLASRFGGPFSWPGHLPGDIRIEKENFSFYFPLTTSILISVVLSALLYLISRFR